jgi:hypothetical protein
MEWLVAAKDTDEVITIVDKLLDKLELSNKFSVSDITLLNDKLTDFKVSFKKQD